MSATFCRVVNGGALVTACKAVTAVSLSANNVGFGAGVKLSWSGAAGGAGNPIRGYEVYRDGVLLTTVFDGTSCTVTSPTSNGSYKYTVKALGRIPGFDAPVSTASATLTSKVSAPKAPTSVWLSATDVRIGKSATLSWSGAAGGMNNAIAKYHVYRNGAYLTETTGTSCAVTASGTAGGKYTYTVYAIGSVSGWNSGASAGVTLTAHGAESVISYFASSTTWTVPSWAERVDVSCIGAGAGGGGGTNWCGGGGGGSGYISHANSISVSPGQTIAITVGGGGAAGTGEKYSASDGGAGGASSAAGISGAGGAGGKRSGTGSGSGGAGGNGGAGGAGAGGFTDSGNTRTSGSGGAGVGTTGAAGFNYEYGPQGGGGGSYKGTGGKKGSNWNQWEANGGVGANTNEYYCFSDPATGRYLNATGGDGGNSSGGTPGRGGQGGQVGKAANGSALSGSGYGRGGRGGDCDSPGSAGQAGLVAVRVWRYVA